MLDHATRNRLISLAAVAVYLTAAAAATEGAEQRAALHFVVVITLGYGHLIGAFWSSRRSGRPGAMPDTRRRGFLAGSLARRRAVAAASLAALVIAFVAFVDSLADQLTVVLFLLAVSTWHTAENDLSLEARYEDRARRSEPILRRLDEPLAALGVTAVSMAAAAASLSPADGAVALQQQGVDPALAAWWLRGAAILAGSALVLRERSPRLERIGLALIGVGVFLPASLVDSFGVGFADLFAATTAYHLASWLVRSVERARAAGDHPGDIANHGAAALLLAAHAVPIALAAVCVSDALPGAERLRAAFFAPAPYLFWSVAHVVDTLIQRRRGRLFNVAAGAHSTSPRALIQHRRRR